METTTPVVLPGLRLQLGNSKAKLSQMRKCPTEATLLEIGEDQKESVDSCYKDAGKWL